MALQGHIEYLRGVLKRTEDERDRSYGEKDHIWRQKEDACRERDQARGERDGASAERDKLRQQLNTVNTELVTTKEKRAQLQEQLRTACTELATMKEERAQLQEQLKTVNAELVTMKEERAQLQERLRTVNTERGEGSGGQVMMTQQLYLRQRQLMEAAQNEEVRAQRVERYVQYAGLAKADMLFWETMIETESRLEGLITARDVWSWVYGCLLIWRAW